MVGKKQQLSIDKLQKAIDNKQFPKYVDKLIIESTGSVMFAWGKSNKDMISLFISETGLCHWVKPYELLGSKMLSLDTALVQIKKTMNASANNHIEAKLSRKVTSSFSASTQSEHFKSSLVPFYSDERLILNGQG